MTPEWEINRKSSINRDSSSYSRHVLEGQIDQKQIIRIMNLIRNE